jgi:hypothetical protein
MPSKPSRMEAQQTFRQFAWNLAGTLKSTKGGTRQPARPGGKRP